MPTFAARLHQKIVEHSPLCVGIDPSAALLKSCNLPDTPDGAFEFGKRVLEAADYRISLLKPQSAFFERFGSAGLKAVEELTTLARRREVLVLLDGKRGDIDTTGAAYAEGYFSTTTTLRVDAVTTHVYLGLAALDPFLDIAVRAEGGVFVVVRSSNPEGRELQTARMANGETVAQNLCREITLRNRKQGEGLQYIGAVVGATCDDAAATVEALPQSFILAPGVGAQGATIQDVLKRMPSARGRVLPNVSRAILANGGEVSDIRTTIRSLQDQSRELL
ncbi:orotidine 5'-phosphate decarboxylase [Steroidobacter agaridevorans]|uniref:Orotidine-5'-phosphate decarboxylase n=1 Tax=Steroidobacter agaridevorans TaxID=2695856 RepID=A0A829YE55_9GAMM|nr:orotidine-5'-phosphate decarboxylase [Steroidobacter agaridevorans]GFE80906.1 orotidine 5'-phosphate decarboxylase [Steroidobacter agaridevorans]